MAKVRRALISVSDKTGIVDFAKGLAKYDIEILSTGGTAKLLKENGIPIKLVSDYTGFPEMLDGRVKTLHPKIHAGLLARRDSKEHMEQLSEHGIAPIDLVVVNLYPFEETVLREGVKLEEAVENIDIGGPTMLRSAAKNYESVAVVVNSSRYEAILQELEEGGGELLQKTRENLMLEVFSHTAKYDTVICSYLSKVFREQIQFPETLGLVLTKVQGLRYGENPHQKACFYGDTLSAGSLKQLHGKELSFNNIIDLDSAFSIPAEFEEPAAAVIKHTNPCGAACGKTLSEAYSQAYACDSVSAFGSIVGLNREVNEETAKEIVSSPFVEAVISPGFEERALEILKGKKNMRLIVADVSGRSKLDAKKVEWGVLLQEKDLRQVETEKCRIVSERKPTDDEFNSLLFAWKISKHVKSNAIVLVRGKRTVGIGAGQMSRVDSVKIACRKAGELTRGAVMASDAFFPFPDAIEEAAQAGVKAVIQPGGSLKDKEIIEAVNKHKMAMVFTGMRHFKH
jgi:phosphoribosylaminoimidazolecarboxamide formyltransferase/IMP cyclohydrolase